MLLELDVYSLNMICNYLESEDKAMLSLVCMDLQSLIVDHFGCTFKNISFLSGFWSEIENEIYMPRFFKAMHGKVEQVEITSYFIVNNKCWLQELTFENVTALNILLINWCQEVKEALQLFAKIFPNVESIKLSGEIQDGAIGIVADIYPNIRKMNLYGKCNIYHVGKMQNLQELFVHFDNNDSDTRLLQEFPKLRSFRYFGFNINLINRLSELRYVENLQELTLISSAFQTIHQDNLLKEMNNLRKVTVYSIARGSELTLNLEDKYFYRHIEGFNITRQTPKDVTQLTVNAPKLRRISYNRENVLPDLFLHNQVAEPFESLEEYSYVCCRAAETAQQNIMRVVMISPKLRVLDISGTKFNIGFIKNLLRILMLANRTNKLHLRCYKTNITSKELLCLNLQKYLTVSFEKCQYNFPKLMYGSYFQIQLGDQPQHQE